METPLEQLDVGEDLLIQRNGNVVRYGLKVGLDGRTLARLDPPPLAVYETTSYSPTGTALDSASGDLWIADGYGRPGWREPVRRGRA